jgi:galactose mutarotase-like enzyme
VNTNDDYRGLGWKHGALTVQRHAAMLAPITFLLPNGRQVNPMHVAPWAEEPIAAEQPGILQRLRGEWPCVPFGYAVSDPTAPADWARLNAPSEPGEEIHGYCSNHPWTWEEREGPSLRLFIDYPAGSPVRRLVRTVSPDLNAPAVDIELRVEIKEACRLPLGLHPIFRLPAEAGAARIEPAAFAEGRTYPGTVELSAPLFAIDRAFASLSAVPGRNGRSIDASRLPFVDHTEELLQLNRIDGAVALANGADGYRVRLTWQKEHFPSLLLWISNRGRKAPPWNGRHLALGMEPVCSPFGLGPAVARADNPLAKAGTPTARDFAAGEVFTTRYRIEAEEL